MYNAQPVGPEHRLFQTVARLSQRANLPMPKVYLIQDDRLVYANPALGRIFGYSREDMLRLSSVLDVIADTHRELVADKLRQRLTGEITTIEYRVQGVRRDGEIIDLDVRSVRTQHRDRPAVIGTMIDITEQLRHEERPGIGPVGGDETIFGRMLEETVTPRIEAQREGGFFEDRN